MKGYGNLFFSFFSLFHMTHPTWAGEVNDGQKCSVTIEVDQGEFFHTTPLRPVKRLYVIV